MCLVGNKRADIARVIPCKNNFCTKFAHRFHFCGLQKLNTLNLRLFHPPLNPCNHFPTVLIKTNWYTISYKFLHCSGLKSIYVYAETVPSIGVGVFDGCDSENCILYVPKGTYDAYWYSKWGYFDNIVEFDATNIRNIVVEPEVQENARYAVNGQRLTAPVKGINLVKYNNGRVKKEIVK